MPRILIADDNSNIHRMVSLALKDSGVDVVAVGNGEAAVRKIAEIHPDLVLADIFMPVRSGYEVCEFVKQDSRYAQTPVVLLIGAFDPFDEREAQRVQADGILKKPFVPPEPLVRMVTELLAKSAVRIEPVTVAAVAVRADRVGRVGAAVPPPETGPAEFSDAAPEEFAPAKAKLEWNAAEQPLAFGTLLETPSAETEDPVVTAQRDPTLGEPAFWSGSAQTDEAQDEAQTEEPLEELPWGAGREGQPLPVEIDGFVETETLEPATTRLETSRGLPELPGSRNQTAAPSNEVLAAPLPPLPELPPFDLSPAGDLASAPAANIFPAFTASDAPAPEAEPENEPVLDLKDFAWARPSYPPGGSDQDTAPQSEANAPMAAASPSLATLVPPSPAQRTNPDAEMEFAPARAYQSDPGVRESIADLGASPNLAADPDLVEAIAQRVIERMQPKIIELVTRELLRPVVEALVQRELEKK